MLKVAHDLVSAPVNAQRLPGAVQRAATVQISQDLGHAAREPGAGRHIYNQYVIRAERRDALRAFLADQGIGTEIYYPVSLHAQACFQYLGYAADAFPESNRAAAETLALPIFPELTAAQREYVVDRIAAFYAQ